LTSQAIPLPVCPPIGFAALPRVGVEASARDDRDTEVEEYPGGMVNMWDLVDKSGGDDDGPVALERIVLDCYEETPGGAKQVRSSRSAVDYGSWTTFLIS